MYLIYLIFSNNKNILYFIYQNNIDTNCIDLINFGINKGSSTGDIDL